MSGGRKALLLAREDKEIQAIFNRAAQRRRDTEEKAADLMKQREDLIKAHHEAEAQDLKALEERIAAMGVTIFEKEKHQVTFHPDEGVVWLEATAGCQCAVCMLAARGITIIGGPHQ